MESLLEKAKKVPQQRRKAFTYLTKEHVELAIAWAKREITPTQMAGVLFGNANKPKSGNALYFVAMAFRKGLELDMIKITGEKNDK